MESRPSPYRTATAWALYAVFGAVAAIWKFRRGELASSGWLAPWIVGVAPSFFAAAFAPVVLFASPRVVTWKQFLGVSAAIAAGLCLYEFSQLWMPWRTFDWGDVLANFVGAAIGIATGRLIFFTRVAEAESAPAETVRRETAVAAER
ncbi:MAG TPA: VanZ family protein [Planctomycetia bacterium]|nr:VanZ family protein [Planctomycetia bacterium]